VEAFIGIALIPESGATFFYPRMMGYSKAFEFATMNSPLSAEQALELGLVNSVVHPKAFPAALRKLALQYAQGPTQTYGFVKHLLQQGLVCSLDQMLEHEAEYQQRAGDSADYREGVAAFIEKRKPQFSGS
ncbi:MAG: enoyl-CoA hydratase-related protein, partial [Ignavibacteria bacterium]